MDNCANLKKVKLTPAKLDHKVSHDRERRNGIPMEGTIIKVSFSLTIFSLFSEILLHLIT